MNKMFKPILFIVIIPAVLLFAVIIISSNWQSARTADQENVNLSNGTFSIDKSSYSFGTISMKDGDVETIYELINAGSEDIFVKELFTSCMCTRAQLTFGDGYQTGFHGMKGHGGQSDFYVGRAIKPGEIVKVKAVFDPNAHGPQGVGPIKRNIILTTNLKDNPNIQFSFDAEVTR